MGWATATTRWAAICRAITTRALIGYFDFETYDDVGPGASIAVMDYNHGTPGLCGGGMLANEFIRLPIHMVDRLPPGTPRWGAGAQAGDAPLAQALHRDHGADAADSDCDRPGHGRSRRCATSGGCRSRASKAMCIRTRLRSAMCRRSVRRRG